MELSTAAAVKELQARGLSRYKIAKTLGVSMVSPYQWAKGVRMNKSTAERFKAMYGILITDAFSWED